jgi:septal ring factor EnvC (AmiA/AmiB activator)
MPSRYMCDVLDDIRKMHKTRNYSGLMGSVEQLQVMAYRMEAALGDKRTIEQYDDEAHKLKRDLKEKRRELASLKKELEDVQQQHKKAEEDLNRARHLLKKETKGGTLVPIENESVTDSDVV